MKENRVKLRNVGFSIKLANAKGIERDNNAWLHQLVQFQHVFGNSRIDKLKCWKESLLVINSRPTFVLISDWTENQSWEAEDQCYINYHWLPHLRSPRRDQRLITTLDDETFTAWFSASRKSQICSWISSGVFQSSFSFEICESMSLFEYLRLCACSSESAGIWAISCFRDCFDFSSKVWRQLWKIWCSSKLKGTRSNFNLPEIFRFCYIEEYKMQKTPVKISIFVPLKRCFLNNVWKYQK